MEPRSPLVAVLLVVTVLAGCIGGSAPTEAGDDVEPGNATGTASGATDATGAVNVSTPHPIGEPFNATLEGTLTADEAHIPFPASPSGSCCWQDLNDASDLFEDGRIQQMEVTLTWTNAEDNHARLSIAADVPWWCCALEPAAETASMGEHTQTVTITTRGVSGRTPRLGVQYNDAGVTTGLDYTLTVDVHPLEDVLALYDAYRVDVPAEGRVQAETVTPMDDEAGYVGMLWFDETDRPVAFREVDGTHGTVADLDLPNGSLVAVPVMSDGAMVRLRLVGPVTDPAATPLEETYSEVEVQTVSGPEPTEGSDDVEVPPGAFGLYPWFEYDDGPQAQNLLVSEEGASISLSSSTGTVATLERAYTGFTTGPTGQFCFSCTTRFSEGSPANILDDDGTYQVDWSNQGATGTFEVGMLVYER